MVPYDFDQFFYYFSLTAGGRQEDGDGILLFRSLGQLFQDSLASSF